MLEIKKTDSPKPKPTGPLGFGKYFSDHMLIAGYSAEQWSDFSLVPYQTLDCWPSLSIFHYGQGVFEGLKAYRNSQGQVRLFRPRDNLTRLLGSCERMCIPAFDPEVAYQALLTLIDCEREWIPTQPGTSMYIRPSIVGAEPALGVHAADTYIFTVILSPSGAYYARGLQPVSLYVETEYVRAVRGGTGAHKVIGNYAASLKASERAKSLGFDQVMWLDALQHRFVEEVGAMNIFFVVDGQVLTPALNGSILPGITRASCLELLRARGYAVSECEVDIDQIIALVESGKCSEIFGTGTAAVISPVGKLSYHGQEYIVGGGQMGPVSNMLYDQLTGIQTGRLNDEFGWVVVL